MKKVFNSSTKSFRLIKFLDKNKDVLQNITYNLKPNNVLFFPVVTSTDEVIDSVTNLYGKRGMIRSYLRYYFPKKVIFTPTLYPKPRTVLYIDDKERRDYVKSNLKGFKGIPKNKLTDTRNLILDYSNIIDLAMIKEKRILSRPNVVKFVKNIIPELICYILFNDPKNMTVEDDVDSRESLIQKLNRNNNLEYLDETDIDEKCTDEFSDTLFTNESFDPLKHFDVDYDDPKSVERWEDYLMKKTSIVSTGGPVTGFDSLGFDTFIISFPLKILTPKYYTKEFFLETVQLKRNILIEPELVYDLSFFIFIFQMYKHYFEGSKYNNPYMEELMKGNKKVIFHIYGKDLEFVIDFEECKEFFKFTPIRFLNMFLNRLKIITIKNLNGISDEEIEKMLSEDEEKDFENTDKKVALKPNDEITLKKINSKINSMILQDTKLQSSLKKISDTKADIEIIDKETDDHVDIIDPTIKFSISDSEIEDILNSSDDEDIDITEEEETDYIKKLPDIQEIEYEEEQKPEIMDDENPYMDINDEKEDGVLEDEEEIEETKIIRKSEYTVIEKTRTPKELKQLKILEEKYRSINIKDKTLETILTTGTDTTIHKRDDHIRDVIRDESAKNMNLVNYQDSYLKNNYQADIINTIKSFSVNKERPMFIVDAEVIDSSTSFSNLETYKFTLKDETGKRHTLKFDLPKVDENGFVKIGGNQKIIKKQILRLPIVKIGPDKVYITTQYNNLQIERSGTILNRSSIILRKLFTEYFDGNKNIEIQRGSGTEGNKDYITTLEYDVLSEMYFSIIVNKNNEFGSHIGIHFDQKYIREKINKLGIKLGVEDKNGNIPINILPIGINYTTKKVYYLNTNDNASVNGTILSILMKELDDPKMISFIKSVKSPKRRINTKIKVQSKLVPLILFTNYLFGWERVQTYFNESKITFSEKRIPDSNDLHIKFKDGFLYYKQFPIQNSIFLNGLTEMQTEKYNYEELFKQTIYLDYINNKFNSKNLIKGWIGIKEMLLDPVTLQVLEELKLPTDLLEIFLYCNELLGDNSFESESDGSHYRIRGHELISECLYRVLCDQYNDYKKRTGKKITMSIAQNAVMSKLHETQIMDNYECSNPVSEMKYLSLVTFKGPGGTKLEQAFTLEKRAFSESYIGLMGITTPDSGNVGVVKQLTQNPKILNTRGLIDLSKPIEDMKLSDIATVEEAMIPNCNLVDDPIRISYTGGQSKHIISIKNASLPIVRTGVEKTLQYQIGDNFATKAKDDGVVTEIDDINKRIFITYNNGVKESVDYSNKLTKNSDIFIENEYIINVKVGQKIKKQDVLVADARFFKKDMLGGTVYTQGRMSMVAIMEGCYTEDDSSMINQSFGDMLKTNVTKRKQIGIAMKDNIIEYKKIGDFIKEGEPIIVFDNSGTFEGDETNDFDDIFKGIDESVLSEMIHQTPRANFTGTIVDMKLYWTAPIEKASKSVKKVISEYTTRMKKVIKVEENFTNTKSPNRSLIEQSGAERRGSDGSTKINGVNLDRDGGLLIEYFISTDNGMGVSDKVSVNSSLKSEVCEVVPKDKEFYRENGKVDMILPMISISSRMVNSIYINGFMGKILHDKSKSIVSEFFNELK